MPKAWRLIEKQAQPSVWVNCKLTSVSCAPVRSSVSLQAVNICPSPRAGQLWRLQLTDRPGARKGVKGRNLQARNVGVEEGAREGVWGEQNRHKSLVTPSLPGHLEQQPEWQQQGPHPLPGSRSTQLLKMWHSCLQANQWFSSEGMQFPRGHLTISGDILDCWNLE